MDTKPPTRTLPRVVMKEWPMQNPVNEEYVYYVEPDGSVKAIPSRGPSASPKALSDFTRVVEETGILDQKRSQKEKSRDE